MPASQSCSARSGSTVRAQLTKSIKSSRECKHFLESASSFTMSDEQSEDWTVPCSDDEAYQDSPPATEGKKRVYEPSGAQIAMLYRQLEKSGAIDLKWQCPGRRSPSVHSNSQVNEKKQSESGDNSKKIEPNEFDFDDEMFDEPSASKIAVPRRKSTSQGKSFNQRRNSLPLVLL